MVCSIARSPGLSGAMVSSEAASSADGSTTRAPQLDQPLLVACTTEDNQITLDAALEEIGIGRFHTWLALAAGAGWAAGRL